MAIDTTEKKLSLMSMGQVYQAALPVPNGSLDQADVQHLLWGYAGILWETAVVATPEIVLLKGSIARSVLLSGELERTVALTGSIDRTVSLSGTLRS